ncbi:MAG: hypothetical protein U1C33_01955 [Candidatus Cloacimonadaceae bacterium]|nr:hypothetical protein [Candidatus Cloacimonadaceae bacterium]
MVAIQQSDPDLYERFVYYLRTLRELDYEDILSLIDQEHSKGDNHSQIKKLSEGKYEFRIPPKHKHKVLRVLFELGDDFDSILITDGFTKTHQPLERKSKKR